ncbi:MAG TPA: DUF6159 family protein [Casimicrobiaceae bacterium]|jgi:hypothetical protein
MFDRFQRSWDLAAECWRLLMEDKALLVFPLMSSIAVILVIGSFAIPLLPAFGFAAGRAPHALSPLGYLGLFAFYWVQYSIIIFFNTALVEVAMHRFDDEDAGVADGLKRAATLLPVILVYALIAATVGTLLRAVAERVGIIGRIVVGLVGVGWTVATALVVPVLAAENVGPIEAIGRSAELIKRSWGEDIIGNVGIGMVFGAIALLVGMTGGVLVVAALGNREWTLGVVLLVAVVLAVSLVMLAQATLQGIYSAALYRFATGDPASGGIDRSLLENAFRTKA